MQQRRADEMGPMAELLAPPRRGASETLAALQGGAARSEAPPTPLPRYAYREEAEPMESTALTDDRVRTELGKLLSFSRREGHGSLPTLPRKGKLLF